MSKKCAKCQKIVYPTEELKCLDKTWHKLCFKCEVCGMTLNMKNYKGFDKLPYCNAHCPTAKHTQVADTPETRRIAENTKIQSNIQYHADFEKQKGHKTSVVDDPEIERIKQNTQIQSNVNYWGLKEQREQMEGRRPNESVDDVEQPLVLDTSNGLSDTENMGSVTSRSRNPGRISDYNPPEETDRSSRYSHRSSAAEEPRSPAHTGAQRTGQGGYAPFSYGGGGSPSGPPPNRASMGVNRSYHEDSSPQDRGQSRSSYGESQQAPYSYAQVHGKRNQPGSIADYDPLNQQRSSAARITPGQSQPHVVHQPPPPQAQLSRPAQPPPKQVVYKALYDYTAADSDEVSFLDGDHIVNVEIVDAGWMLGTVQRTGQHGMLPSNYVERVN